MTSKTKVEIKPGALEAFNGILDATIERCKRDPQRAKEIILAADLVAAAGILTVTDGGNDR